MISNLLAFGAGLILGGALMLAFILIMIVYEHRPKKPPTKEEWRIM